MQKFEGIHFYVNVANFNEVVIDEESKNTVLFIHDPPLFQPACCSLKEGGQCLLHANS